MIKRLAGVALSAAAVISTVSAPASAAPSAVLATPASNWTQDGYGAGNTGYNPYESKLNLNTVDDLTLRWKANPAPGEEGCETTPEPPLVADGRVIIFESGGIGARRAKDGKRLWLNTDFSYLGKTMAVADDLVIVTDTSCHSQSDYTGTVTALDITSGDVAWQTTHPGMIDNLVVDAGVIVAHGYCGVCDDEDTDVVIAFRTSDGAELWRYAATKLAGEVIAAGRVLLTSTTTSGTRAVSLWTGKVTWHTRMTWWALSSTPVGDRFLARGGTGFSAVNSRTGKIVWSVRGKADSISTDGRRVFVSGSALTTYLATTGAKLWSRTLSQPGKPVRAGGLLYVTNAGTALAILSPVNGNKLANGKPYGTALDHVVVAGARLLTTDGTSIRSYGF
ncbi:MAG: PQQ-binding-like beta-propeller repeat protein [Actinoplanes sp.]